MSDRYLVVAPPPTPNGDIHVGHLSGPYLGADVFTRYQRLRGQYVTAALSTDEHQTYVVTTAERLGRDPRELAATSHREVAQTLQDAGVAFDVVGRPNTSYTAFVQQFFARLFEADAFECRADRVGYDPAQDRYLFESYASGRCPVCLALTKGNICETCGSPNNSSQLIPLAGQAAHESRELTTWVLPLERYRDRLETFYRDRSAGLRPSLHRLLDRLLRADLPAFPITFPSEWGIPVGQPGTEGLVLNVWAEMYAGHLYWLSQSHGWSLPQGDECYVQFLGFDNSFFYAVAHPCIAFAAQDVGLEVVLPDYLYTNEFYQYEHFKFSTSQRHLVWARDLVTPRNPKSHYTFINYLKETGRLFEYLNLGLTYPLRKEYARYISWVANHFDAVVKYRTEVTGLELVSHGGKEIWRLTTMGGETYLARSVVVAPGRTPRIPPEFGAHLGAQIFHLNHYLRNIESLGEAAQRIAVIGASQSAVEILLDLMERRPGAEIYAIQRTFGFRLKDTSPFSDHVYFPEFVDYFYELPETSKADLRRQLRQTNYSSADGDVLHQLYLKMYEERLDDKERFHLLNNTAIEAVSKVEDGWRLQVREVHLGEQQTIEVDAVVLATGFLDFSPAPHGRPYPELLEAVSHRLPLDEKGVVVVERDYAVNLCGNEDSPGLYLNGLCESSHGLGDAGSFSLLSLRAQDIATSLHRRHLCTATALDREYAYEGA